ALQLSEAVTPPVTSGIAAWQCASADAVVGAGQLIAGGVVSTTVKVVTQLLLLLAASVAVTVIVCGPSPTVVPAAGLWVIMIDAEGVQLSKAVTPPVTSGIAAWQLPSADAVVGAGQLTVGRVVSPTVKAVVQVLLVRPAPVAV